jgi:hypothetical protein
MFCSAWSEQRDMREMNSLSVVVWNQNQATILFMFTYFAEHMAWSAQMINSRGNAF